MTIWNSLPSKQEAQGTVKEVVGWIGGCKTPWGSRLILAASAALPSEKSEKCHTAVYYRLSWEKNCRLYICLGPILDTLTTNPRLKVPLYNPTNQRNLNL